MGLIMKRLSKSAAILSIGVGLILTGDASYGADQLTVGDFSTSGLGGWQEKSFKGHNDYHLIENNTRKVIEVSSHGTASALIRKITFSPDEYPILRWSWKIAATLPSGDERTKAGDDYAARVYVVFAGKHFWETRAIVYIWANRLEKDSVIANAFTANAMMVAVQSGNKEAGKWMSQERNLLNDYQQLFGSHPGEAEAVAIMTDTDNTGEKATAWYGDISLGQ